MNPYESPQEIIQAEVVMPDHVTLGDVLSGVVIVVALAAIAIGLSYPWN